MTLRGLRVRFCPMWKQVRSNCSFSTMCRMVSVRRRTNLQQFEAKLREKRHLANAYITIVSPAHPRSLTCLQCRQRFSTLETLKSSWNYKRRCVGARLRSMLGATGLLHCRLMSFLHVISGVWYAARVRKFPTPNNAVGVVMRYRVMAIITKLLNLQLSIPVYLKVWSENTKYQWIYSVIIRRNAAKQFGSRAPKLTILPEVDP